MAPVGVKLTSCRWRDSSVEDIVIASPSWDEVAAAIERLDGATFSELFLHLDDAEDETYLTVAGGPDAFLVFVCVANEEFHEAIDPAASDSSVTMVVGGQQSTFGRRELIDREHALVAAHTYFDTATLDASITWHSR